MNTLAKITAVLIVSLSAAPSMAEKITCTHSDLSEYGAKTTASATKREIVISWLGEKVTLDTEKQTLQTSTSEGAWDPVSLSKIQKTKNFTTYSAHVSTTDGNGTPRNITYSLRIYADDTSEFSMRQHRYKPLKAKGTCK